MLLGNKMRQNSKLSSMINIQLLYTQVKGLSDSFFDFSMYMYIQNQIQEEFFLTSCHFDFVEEKENMRSLFYSMDFKIPILPVQVGIPSRR